MKLELTNPKAWKKLAERNIDTASKLKIYEKLGGAYRFAHNENEQVFNKLTELIKYAIKERNSKLEYLEPGEGIVITQNGKNMRKFSVKSSTNNGATILSQDGNTEIELKTFNGKYTDMKGKEYQIQRIAKEYDYKSVTKKIDVDAPTYDEDVSQSYTVDEPVAKPNNSSLTTKVRTTPKYTREGKSVRREADTPNIKVSKGDIGDVDGKSMKPNAASFTAEENMPGEDHEVGMAMGQLDDIIRNANELKGKIGTSEFNMPGWIQDHISQSQNFINQANTGYHELKPKK